MDKVGFVIGWIVGVIMTIAIIGVAGSVKAETLVVEPGSPWSDGGFTSSYKDKRDSVDAIEIRGKCTSACPMFLSHPNVCIEPETAFFEFHALRKWFRKAPWKVQVGYTHYLGSEKLGEWFLNGPAKSTKITGQSKLTGVEMVEVFGFKECTDD